LERGRCRKRGRRPPESGRRGGPQRRGGGGGRDQNRGRRRRLQEGRRGRRGGRRRRRPRPTAPQVEAQRQSGHGSSTQDQQRSAGASKFIQIYYIPSIAHIKLIYLRF